MFWQGMGRNWEGGRFLRVVGGRGLFFAGGWLGRGSVF
jgi:hypothetical protein